MCQTLFEIPNKYYPNLHLKKFYAVTTVTLPTSQMREMKMEREAISQAVMKSSVLEI
jgi:hypothetical protein